ncbi:MAG: hypothetical protein CVU05_04230 [Bacteroidetes bacterium HGW-Bacteroidetes-21]|nr:MAG: hypothetical protein CVU05_04230 [Bacteroidetes bacterium HGW-Bacteroidetes-21]
MKTTILTTIKPTIMKTKRILLLLMVFWAYLAHGQMTEKWLTAEAVSTVNNQGVDLVKDASGNVFVTAKKYNGSNYDISLIKYNSSGVKQWEQLYNGGADDSPIGIAIDASSNIYIGGNSFTSGVTKMKALMYNSSGVLQWQYTSGAAYEIRATSMDLFGTSLHLAGYAVVSGTNTNAFFVKLSATGTATWSQSYDNVSVEKAFDIKVRTTNGDVYATGITGTNIFTIRYNSTGVLQWVQTYASGSGNSITMGGVSTAFGVYVSGNYNDDGIILKYNESGVIQWNKTVNGTIYNNYNANDILFYSTNIYVGVSSDNIDYPSKVLKYNAAGTLQWTYVSSSVGGVKLLGSGTSLLSMYNNTIDKVNLSSGLIESAYNWTDFHPDVVNVHGSFYSFALGDNSDVLVTGTFRDDGDTHDRIMTLDICTPLSPVSIVSPATSNICEDVSYDAVAGGSTNYLWYFYSNVIDPAPITNIVNNTASTTAFSASEPVQEWKGLYLILKGTDTYGCPDYDSVQITVLPAPYLSPTTNIISDGPLGVCSGGAVEFSTTNYYQMTDWYVDGTFVNSTNNSQTFTTTTPGDYYAIVWNDQGCSDTTESITMYTITAPPTLDLGADITTCEDYAENISANVDGYYIWSTGETTQEITTYGTGVFTVTVTVPGCTPQTDNLEILSRLPNPKPNLGPDQNVCSSVEAFLNAGAGYVSYLWNDGNTSQSRTVYNSGNYSVKVTNLNGCFNRDTIYVSTIPSPEVTLSSNQSICSGASVSLTASNALVRTDYFNFYEDQTSHNYTTGGIVSYEGLHICSGDTNIVIGYSSGSTGYAEITVDVTPGVNDLQLSMLTKLNSGTVDITIDGINFYGTPITTGCTANILSFTGLSAVTADGEVIIRFADNNSTAFNGRIYLNSVEVYSVANSGTRQWTSIPAGYTSSLQNITVSPTETTQYIYTYNDGTCSSHDTVKVTVMRANLGADINICSGSTVLDAGSGFSSYLWSTGATTQTITVSTAGTYAVTVTHPTCGTSNDAVNVTFNSGSSVNLGADVASCTGSTVTLNAGITGTYLWNTGATTQTIAVTVDGIYAVTVTNAQGCTSTDNNTVTFYSSPTLNLGSDIVACSNETVTLNAGAGYTYNWSTGATTQTINPTSSGIYSVTITGAGSCTSSDQIIVTINPQPTLSLGPDLNSCDGQTVILSANAASSYLWSNSATTQSISATLDGLYSVTITGSNGCTNTDGVVIDFHNVPTVDLGSDFSVCGNPSVTLSASVGNTYLWSTGATTQDIYPTTSGTYTVTVTNVDGCTAHDDVIVTFNPLPAINLGADISVCSGTPVTLNAGTASSYLWSTGATTSTINVTTSANYSVTITSAAGCTNSDGVVVDIHGLPAANLGADITVCSGTGVNLDAGAGNTYSWSTGATTQSISPTTSGTYAVTVTNSYSCTASDAVTVTINPIPTVNLGSDLTRCVGQSVTLNAGTATTYAWSTGVSTQTISPTTSGTYTVTVSNSFGCTSSDAVLVTINPLPTVNLGSDLTRCEGQTATLNAGTASSYIWSTGATTQTIGVTTTGTYTVTVQNSYGCSNSDNVNVTFNAIPTVNLGADQTLCQGNSATLNAGSGYTYLWSNGATSQTITTGTAGTYTVTVTLNGCQNSDLAIVTVNALPVVNLGPDFTSCTGSTVVLNAGAGADTYTWSTGASSQTINVTANGTYSVTVTTNGCSANDAVTATFQSSLSVDLGADILSCEGETVSLNAGSGFDTYLWSNGSTNQSIPVTQTGNYSVTVTSGACPSVSDNANVTFNTLPSVDLGSNLSGCAQVELEGGSGFASYLWSTTQTTENITVVSSGNYSVTVTDASGCSNTDNVDVTVNQNPTADLGSDLAGCSSVTIQELSGNTDLNYVWSNSSTDSQITVSSSGNYSVTITDVHGCTDDDMIDVIVYELFTLDSTIVDANCGNNDGSATVTVNGGTPVYNFNWSSGGTMATESGLAAGTYQVIVTDAHSCSNTINVVIGNTNAPELTLSSTPVTCYGLCNGVANVVASGGAAPYDYEWNNAIYSETNSDICPGTYEVTVTDNNNCIVVESITVSQPDELAVSYVVTGDSLNTVTVAEGSITLNATGGTQPYFYIWGGGETTASLSDLLPGIYFVTITDDHGCYVALEIEIEGIITSINDGDISIALNIYPNPSYDGVFYINSSESIQKIEIFNLIGERILIEENNQNIIRLSEVKPGIYYARIYSTNNQCVIKKLVKE